MNLSRPHIRHWVYILCGGIISIIPNDCDFGFSGNHWYLGWPFYVGTLIFGGNWWESDFSGLHFICNTIIWYLIILFAARGAVYYRNSLPKRTKKFILFSFLVVTVVPIIYFLSLGPALKLAGVTISGSAVYGREGLPLWIRFVYYPLFRGYYPGSNLIDIDNYIFLWIN